MSREFASILLVAALLLPLAASSQSDPPGSAALDADLLRHLPPGAARVHADERGVQREAPVLDVAAALRLVDVEDPSTYPRATRAILEAASSLPGGLPMAASSLDAHASSSVARRGLPAGDLTGDGLADVLVVETPLGGTAVTIRALRGHDGAEAWTRTLLGADSAFLLAAPDLTGDGAPDAIVLTFSVDAEQYQCAPLGCGVVVSYRTVVHVLSGATGASAWTRSTLGSLSYAAGGANAPFSGAFAFAYTATGAVAFPLLGGDHDGDGLPDLVLHEYDIVRAYGFGGALAFAGAFESFSSTRASVVRGADGATLHQRDQPLFPGVAFLLPAGQAVGDATTDLLWVVETTAYAPFACALVACAPFLSVEALDLVMVDGRTYSATWRMHSANGGYVIPAKRDLDGDGFDDIVITDFWALRAFSGRHGTPLWVSTEGWFPLAFGPVGGQPGADVLAWGDSRFTATAFTTELVRLDGATGRVLLRTSSEHPVAGSFRFAFVGTFGAGDQDGDGADEVSQTIFVSNGTTAAGASRIESTASGAVLHAHAGPTFSVLLPAGDLGGEGPADAVLLVEEGNWRSPTGFSLTAVATPGGSTWTRHEAFGEGSWWSVGLRPNGDQTGDGVDDLVYTRWLSTEGAFASRVDALDGASGALTWGVGDPLPG